MSFGFTFSPTVCIPVGSGSRPLFSLRNIAWCSRPWYIDGRISTKRGRPHWSGSFVMSRIATLRRGSLPRPRDIPNPYTSSSLDHLNSCCVAFDFWYSKIVSARSMDSAFIHFKDVDAGEPIEEFFQLRVSCVESSCSWELDFPSSPNTCKSLDSSGR